jgi:hypothetical protein
MTASIDTYCRLLTEILPLLSTTFLNVESHDHSNQTRVNFLLLHIAQLLSCPASLKVALHRGLSAEVQEAARGVAAPPQSAWLQCTTCLVTSQTCWRPASSIPVKELSQWPPLQTSWRTS